MVLFDYNGIKAMEANWLWSDGVNIITKRNYGVMRDRGKLTILQRSAPGCPAVISYESLPVRIKIKVDKKLAALGELSGVGAAAGASPENQPQRCFFETEGYIKPDQDAETFFKKYKLRNGTGLPREVIAEYCMNASVLNGVRELLVDRRAAGNAGGMSAKNRKRNLFPSVINDLKGLSALTVDGEPKYPHTLPMSERNLRQLLREYNECGYIRLVHKNYDNSNAEKLTEESKEWLVAKWAAQVPVRLTLFQLYMEYVEKAKKEEWEEVTLNTIYGYLFKPEVKSKWYGARHGELAAKAKYNRQHETILPEVRDALWYGDGTKLNYYYLNEKGEVATTSVYEIMDVYSECLLGYHISDSEDFETQYRAYKSAMYFSGHKPYEIRFDNQGGHKKLQSGQFFKKLSHLAIPTAPYNGRSKTIESAFGRFQAEFLHKEWYFTGQNITAKKLESKANKEFVLANTKNLPTLSEIKKIYSKRRDEWNHAPHHETGISRIKMYRSSTNEKSKKIELQDMIFMFGVRAPKPVIYRSNGISIEVKGVKYRYEVLDCEGNPDFEFLRLNVDREFIVEYDPEDMTAVSLFTPANGRDDVCFVAIANKYIKVHRDKQSQNDFDHHFIKTMELMNKRQRVEMQEATELLLEKYGLHPSQHGLRMPGIKGLNRKKYEDVGVAMKRESNLVPVLEDVYDRI